MASMTYRELDHVFPFIVFAYGFVMMLIFNGPILKWAEARIDQRLLEQLKAHRLLGLICLLVGALWSAQNLLF